MRQMMESRSGLKNGSERRNFSAGNCGASRVKVSGAAWCLGNEMDL